MDALTEQKAQHQQRIAEYAARVEKLDRAMAEVRQELAETLVKLSSVEAQLIEARTMTWRASSLLATCSGHAWLEWPVMGRALTDLSASAGNS